MDSYICECNSISKNEIADAIKQLKLCTVDEVSHHTNASTGCGRCRRVVRNLLKELNSSGPDED